MLGPEEDCTVDRRRREVVEDGKRREEVEGEMGAERRRQRVVAATC